jgi:hypothetical protein
MIDMDVGRSASGTYTQQWKAYDKSQTEEKIRFMELLKDLVEVVKEPEYQFGRPKITQRDLIFASALKVYSMFSLRRFITDLKDAKEIGFIGKAPCFASVGHFMQREDTTPTLKKLIQLSASILKSVETHFAVDSSGFRTTKFSDYCIEKHRVKRMHQWLKAHVIVGVETHIVTDV